MKKLTLFGTVILFTCLFSYAQKNQHTIPLLGDKSPAFTAQSTEGTIHFPDDYGKSWKILFSHPRDFTPVCSSELLELAYRQDEFKALNTEIIVLSADNLEQHERWKTALEELTQKNVNPVEIHFPLIDDASLEVSNKYGMLHQSVSPDRNIRGVYVIDPENVIRSIHFYPNEMGRNIEELKRTVLALQFSEANERSAMPVNWNPGDDYLVSFLTPDEKKAMKESLEGNEFYQLAWFLTYKKYQSEKE